MNRIIFVNRVSWPAEEATAQLQFDLTRQLSRLGWDCHVVTSSAAPPTYDVEGGSVITFHRVGLSAASRKTHVLAKAFTYRHYNRAALRFLETFVHEKDVVVLMTDPPLLAVKLSALVSSRRARLWHWTQDVYPEVAAALTSQALLRWFLRRMTPARNRAWRNADHIVTIGEDMAALIRREIGDATPVSIVANWFPSPTAALINVDFRKRWAIPSNHVCVLYAGNLGRAHTLLPILDLADKTRSDQRIHYVFVGSGPQKSPLEQAAKIRGLTQVHFEPAVPRPELESLLAAGDVHLVTMRPECRGTVLPSKFYGIMAAHRPCLFIGPPASDLGEIISANRLGAVGTPEDLSAPLQFLEKLTDDEQFRSIQQQSVALFHDQLPTLSVIGQIWDKLLHNVRSGA